MWHLGCMTESLVGLPGAPRTGDELMKAVLFMSLMHVGQMVGSPLMDLYLYER